METLTTETKAARGIKTVPQCSNIGSLVLFCFGLTFLLSLKPQPFVQSFFDMRTPRDSHTQLPNNCPCPVCSVLAYFAVSLEMSLFPSISYRAVFLCTKITLWVFPFWKVFSYLVTTGWIFYISLLCEDSVNQSKESKICNTTFCKRLYTDTS